MESKEKDFKEISNTIMKVYHDEMHRYLNANSEGTLTDHDVIIMIMNLTIGISTNIYYSLKQILPTTNMDFDFIRAKLSNSLVDSFEKIKDYNPKESAKPLTMEQIKEIQENGFAVIKMPDGSERRITQDEILVKKKDADKITEAIKKDTIHAGGAKKIIIPSK